jgi:hypothetical protein
MLVYLARHARPVFDPQRIECAAASPHRDSETTTQQGMDPVHAGDVRTLVPPTEAELLRESRLSPRGEAQAAHMARVLMDEASNSTANTGRDGVTALDATSTGGPSGSGGGGGSGGVALVLRAPTGVCAATISIMESIWSREIHASIQGESALAPRTRTTQALAPGASVRDALDLIHEHAGLTRGGLMLLGHNPQLGELLATLAGGVGARNLILRSGEIIALEVRANQPIGTARVCGRWMPVAVGSLQLTGASETATDAAFASRRAA